MGKVMMTTYIEEKTKKELQKRAKYQDKSLNRLVVELLSKAMTKEKK